MHVTTHGSLAGLLGPVFLLSPLGLLALRRREGRRLLFAALVFGANYFGNIGTRFLIPVLPFVALAMALALNSAPRLMLAVAVTHAVISWPSIVTRYCRFDAWHLVKVTVREALRIKPEDGFLESNLPYYGAARMIERATPPGATIFSLAPIPEAYTSRIIRVGYQSAANIVTRQLLWDALPLPSEARRQAVRQVKARGIDFLLVLDDDIGAAELHDAGSWGLRAIGEHKGARLYELP
jgi:hypothetical protein